MCVVSDGVWDYTCWKLVLACKPKQKNPKKNLLVKMLATAIDLRRVPGYGVLVALNTLYAAAVWPALTWKNTVRNRSSYDTENFGDHLR